MIKKTYIPILSIALASILFSQKSSQDIQTEIEAKKNDVRKIKNEIDKITNQIKQTDIQTRQTKKNLIQIEKQIKLTEDLLALIKAETENLSESTLNMEIDIVKKEKEMRELKQEYSNMITHLYKTENNGRLDILFSSKNWNDTVYKVKYLEILSNQKDDIETELNQIILELNQKIIAFADEFSNKKELINIEKERFIQLENKKVKEQGKEEQLISETKKLEQKRSNNKQALVKIDKLLSQLYIDKDAAEKREEEIRKKREEELRRIKEEKEREERRRKQQFANNKGNLPWPIQGTIIESYNQSKQELGIKIKTNKNEDVVSVFHGIVAKNGKLDDWGRVIQIDHGNGYHTVYFSINSEISVGQEVESGTLIGSTANEMFEFYVINMNDESQNKNSIFKNPGDWLK